MSAAPPALSAACRRCKPAGAHLAIQITDERARVLRDQLDRVLGHASPISPQRQESPYPAAGLASFRVCVGVLHPHGRRLGLGGTNANSGVDDAVPLVLRGALSVTGETVARTRTVVWTMPMSSMECRDGPVLSHRRDRVTLSYDLPGPTGEYLWESVVFLGVAALGFTPRAACSRDQASASNRLVELEGSAWRTMVKGATGRGAALRHLRITFEATGCYDLLALTFVPPPTDRSHGIPHHLVSRGSA